MSDDLRARISVPIPMAELVADAVTEARHTCHWTACDCRATRCGLTHDNGGDHIHQCDLPDDHSDCEYEGYHQCACGVTF